MVSTFEVPFFFLYYSEVKNNLEISGLTVSIQNVLEILENESNIKSIYKFHILERKKENYIFVYKLIIYLENPKQLTEKLLRQLYKLI